MRGVHNALPKIHWTEHIEWGYVRGIVRPEISRRRCPMIALFSPSARRRFAFWQVLRRIRHPLTILTLLILVPALALAQSGGTPFDTGFTALQNLFTRTIAKVASLIAIVIGGYQFAHGEPGAKKSLAGVAAGTGIAVLAVNVLNWLWGI